MLLWNREHFKWSNHKKVKIFYPISTRWNYTKPLFSTKLTIVFYDMLTKAHLLNGLCQCDISVFKLSLQLYGCFNRFCIGKLAHQNYVQGMKKSVMDYQMLVSHPKLLLWNVHGWNCIKMTMKTNGVGSKCT